MKQTKSIIKTNDFKNNGITLIALVITIIVLLILAGVSIAMLTGDNGILTQAQNAKNKTEEAALEEKIKILSAEAMINEQTGRAEEKTAQQLQDELNKQGENVLVVQWNKYIIFDLDKNKEYRVTSDGEVQYYGESTMGNILKNTTVPNSGQKENRNDGCIGIGTDGNTVNLDLWVYNIDNNRQTSSKGYALNEAEWIKNPVDQNDIRTHGYVVGENEENIVDGKIKGCVPMYIKPNQSEYWIAVTSMLSTFSNIKNLVIPPEIPNTVIDLNETFLFCDSLTSMPEIPNDVISMRATFKACNKLVNVTDIPNKVENMASIFQNCEALESFGDIPDSVNNLSVAFYNCTNLKKIGNIGKGVKDMSLTFQYCRALKYMPNIPEKVENLRLTFADCSALTDVDAIVPETVYQLEGTFAGCSNLQGKIEINATKPENYSYCLGNCAINGTGLTITGTGTILQDLKSKYSSNTKINFE